jgi:hypothetical protein
VAARIDRATAPAGAPPTAVGGLRNRFAALIIFFLIAEPHGLARLWQIGKATLRRWPFSILPQEPTAALAVTSSLWYSSVNVTSGRRSVVQP